MTFDEAFASQRRFSDARFSPDGRRLLFSERMHSAPTRGLLRPLAGSVSYVADLESGEIQQVRAAGLEGVDLAWCEPWSPDGRYAAMLVGRGGVQLFAYWDETKRRLATLGPPPAALCGDWVNGAYVYRARLTATPGAHSGKAEGLDVLVRRWRSAWSGAGAEVTVHSNNPSFPSPSRGQVPDEMGLVLADPVTGKWSIIGRGAFYSIKPSPDGQSFAVLRAGPVLAGPIGRYTARQGVLQIYRIAGGKAELVRSFADLDVNYGALAWSADGSRLLAAARRPTEPALRPVVVDMASGVVTWVPLPEGVSLTLPGSTSYQVVLPLGWIGGSPAYIGRSDKALHLASALGSDHGQARGGQQLYVVTNGEPASLTKFLNRSVLEFVSSSDGEGLVTAEGVLWAVAPGRAPRRVGSPALKITAFAEALPDVGRGPELAIRTVSGRDRVGVKVVTADGEPRLAVLDVATGDEVFSTPAEGYRAISPRLDAAATLTRQGWSSSLAVVGAQARRVHVGNPEWRDRPTGMSRRISYKVGDRTLHGWVLLPPDYAGGRLPAVVWIYGGKMYGADPPPSTGTDYGETLIFNGQLWAAQGYAVIYPSTPLGRASESDVPQALADSAVAAVDAAVAEGWVDPDRAGIIGFSFGGYSTAAVLAARSDRFKAGVAMSGIYDAAASWGARDLWQTLVDEDDHDFFAETRSTIEDAQLGLQAPPWRAPGAYMRSSPFYRVSDIRTPLLLMVGDLDLGRTSLQQMERFYAALVREGNPAVAVRYWGQGHTQYDPGVVQDQWRRACAWFAHYLKPESKQARAECSP